MVLRGSFACIEHVLLALKPVFVAYIFSGVSSPACWLARIGARQLGGWWSRASSPTRHGILVPVSRWASRRQRGRGRPPIGRGASMKSSISLSGPM